MLSNQPTNTFFFHQINGVSHFSNDLGLDSLDTVEVVMAIEEVRAHTVSLGKKTHREQLQISNDHTHRSSALRSPTRRPTRSTVVSFDRDGDRDVR